MDGYIIGLFNVHSLATLTHICTNLIPQQPSEMNRISQIRKICKQLILINVSLQRIAQKTQERGRIMAVMRYIQACITLNSNNNYMDFSKHNQGTTSVKVHHAPGGKSNFSLGWDEPPAQKNASKVEVQKSSQQEMPLKPNQAPYNSKPQEQAAKQEQPAAGKTSVKVHAPPGGKSNIIFG